MQLIMKDKTILSIEQFDEIFIKERPITYRIVFDVNNIYTHEEIENIFTDDNLQECILKRQAGDVVFTNLTCMSLNYQYIESGTTLIATLGKLS